MNIPIFRDPTRGLGRFIGRPQVEILEAPFGVTRVKLLAPFQYVTYRGLRIFVPEGFVYDGASIPPPLWVRLGHPLAWSSVFGIVHDWLYRSGLVPREEADLLAWDMALLCKHSEQTAAEIHAGLVLGAQSAWDRNVAKRAECGSDTLRLLAWVD